MEKEEPSNEQSVPSKEVSAATNKNTKTQKEANTKIKEDEPILDQSETAMEPDESFSNE